MKVEVIFLESDCHGKIFFKSYKQDIISVVQRNNHVSE